MGCGRLEAGMDETPKRPADPFSIIGRLKSFRFAFKGIAFVLTTQHNAWVHLAFTALAVGAGLLLGIRGEDWRWLIAAITLVWFAEAINTAFEYVCDVVSPEFSRAVARAKDIAAGAVLICSIGAAAIGLLTFWPYLA